MTTLPRHDYIVSSSSPFAAVFTLRRVMMRCIWVGYLTCTSYRSVGNLICMFLASGRKLQRTNANNTQTAHIWTWLHKTSNKRMRKMDRLGSAVLHTQELYAVDSKSCGLMWLINVTPFYLDKGSLSVKCVGSIRCASLLPASCLLNCEKGQTDDTGAHKKKRWSYCSKPLYRLTLKGKPDRVHWPRRLFLCLLAGLKRTHVFFSYPPSLQNSPEVV